MDKKKLNERLSKKSERLGFIPEEYLAKFTTPTSAIIVEGKKDFTQYNNRDVSVVAWFEFLLGLTKLKGLRSLNRKYRLQFFSPLIVAPDAKYVGFAIRHQQDGTISFGGRVGSLLSVSGEQATLELLSYLQEAIKCNDEETRAYLQEYGVAEYEL